ncbi:MAG: outer membrane lipoprotein carrier protein LolA [Thermodesulfovibrionales bacterium]|nr:outer membrane lipoprotein carrier protein LolA [Thermodesulfovibrionales bacterium]
MHTVMPGEIFRKSGLCFFLVLFSFLLPVTVQGVTVDDEITRIQQAYENLQDIKGNFVQKSYIKDLKRTDTFKGQFFIKRPMMLKWCYRGENEQEVFIKNDEIIIYQKKEKQAFKGNFNRETYGQAPIALLSGFGRIREEFSASMKNGKLILKPKKAMGGIVSIELQTSGKGFPIQSFTVIDLLNNRLDMVLSDIQINTGLKESFFSPALPKGVTILEHSS